MGVLRNDRGQAVVELTLMLPFIFVFLMFIAEFGFMFYTYVTVNNAAAEGARWAAVAHEPDAGCATDSIQWRMEQTSGGTVDCSNSTFTIQYEDPTVRGTGVSVQVSREYTAVTPLPALLNFVSWGAVPTTYDMVACSDARLESPMTGSAVTGSGSCGG